MIGRFRPYRALLRPALPRFWMGVFAGVVASLASGGGMPLMAEKVFPVIFADDEGARAEAPGWLDRLRELLGFADTADALVAVACLILPFMFLLRAVGSFFSAYFVGYTGAVFVEALRLKCFEKLQRVPLKYHSKRKDGDLVSSLMTDTQMLQQAVVQTSQDLIVQPCTLLAALAALTYMSFTNSAVGVILIALASLPLCVLPIRLIGKKMVKKARGLQDETGGLTAVLSENLASQPEVRAYNMEDAQISVFSRMGKQFVRWTMKVLKYRQLTSPSVEFVSALGVSLAIYYGSRNGLTFEQFVPVVMALFFCYEPVKKLGQVQNRFKQGEASLDRLELILNAEMTMPEPAEPKTWDSVEGAVTFENVAFAYDDEPVLDGLSFEVESGTMVALVGPSGAGKSTVVNLLERFYDVDSGRVSIDGVDVREVMTEHLREQIGYVSQSPILFSGTIAENILIGRPGASQEDVVAAARRANAHEFIEALPDGYETVLGQRGSGLSGGQRQRVAIARACLKDAPILVLDEATSALDAESESKVQAALAELMKGRTTLVIAHRFSSIKAADRILVFEKGARGGRITGDGTHGELIENHALYRELYRQQTEAG